MKVAFGIFILLLGLSASALNIGFPPGGDPEQGKKGALVIAQALQDKLHQPVSIYFSKDNASLIEAMKSKKIDFAFFNAMTYVFAEQQAGAKVLLKKVWAEPYYHAVVLTKKSSKIKSLKDLKGKSVGFVDQNSTSGSLYPQYAFKKAGISLSAMKEIKYSGSHIQSVMDLDSGSVDAIATFADDKDGLKNAYVKYSKVQFPAKQIKLLWISDPIPTDPFCVRQDFYDQDPKLTHTLMFSLIDVVEQLKDSKEVREAVGASSLMPATSRQYDSVREMVKELAIKL